MTTDRVKIIDDRTAELNRELAKVDWSKFLAYGIVKVQVRDGKPVLVTKEETIKIDTTTLPTRRALRPIPPLPPDPVPDTEL